MLEINISDHFLIDLVKKNDRNSKATKFITCRSFANFDLDSFKADLRLFDFNSIVDTDTVWDLL